MTPQELMRNRAAPLRLVIFDCDGVLVDSEHLSNRVLAEELTAQGWVLTTAQAQALFIGTTLRDIQPRAEAMLGRAMPPNWPQRLLDRIVAVMGAEAVAIAGSVEALHGVTALGLPWRIASNSSHAEMAVKFERLDIASLVAGRVHSHEDVRLGKPAPDLFLATAAAEGVQPGECLVIEDSVAGATAARAAGMDCLAYVPHGDGAALRAVGAVPFRTMSELPALVALSKAHAA